MKTSSARTTSSHTQHIWIPMRALRTKTSSRPSARPGTLWLPPRGRPGTGGAWSPTVPRGSMSSRAGA
eukprot:13018193-Alexandrium_andersonii.AAC.1